MKLNLLKHAGFTLVELLVVIFIISIVTSVALLTISHNNNKQWESIATQLSEVMTLAEEEALLQPAILGMNIRHNQIQFVQLITENKKESWQAIQLPSLNLPNLPNDVALSISHDEHENDAEKNIPQIIFGNSFDLTPFTIYIGKQGQKPSFAVIGEATGMIKTQSLS